MVDDGQCGRSAANLPPWFLWQVHEILVYSRANTPRIRNVRAQPRIAANFDGDGDGGNVCSIEGFARVIDKQTRAADVPPACLAKYARKLQAYGWMIDGMLVDYLTEVRITATRVCAWP